jgi:hypothetical protein
VTLDLGTSSSDESQFHAATSVLTVPRQIGIPLPGGRVKPI